MEMNPSDRSKFIEINPSDRSKFMKINPSDRSKCIEINPSDVVHDQTWSISVYLILSGSFFISSAYKIVDY